MNENQTGGQTYAQTQKNASDEVLERILKERQEVYEAKLRQLESDFERKHLELRIQELEKKMAIIEKSHDENSGGIKASDIMTGVATYFAMQQQKETK